MIPASQGYHEGEAKQFLWAQNTVGVHSTLVSALLSSPPPGLYSSEIKSSLYNSGSPRNTFLQAMEEKTLPWVLLEWAGLWLGWCHSCALGCLLVKRNFNGLKNSQGELSPMHGKEDIFCPISKSSLHRLLSKPSDLFIKMPTYSDYLATNHTAVNAGTVHRV